MDRLRLIIFLWAIFEIGNAAFQRDIFNMTIAEALQNLLTLMVPLEPLPPLRTRILEASGGDNPFYGNDVYHDWVRHPYEFFRVCGETPASFRSLLNDLRPTMRAHRILDEENILLMTLFWLRRYPIQSELSLIFDIPQSAVSRILNEMIPVLHNLLAPEIVWPTNAEWQRLRGIWKRIPNAVGAIDGTSHPIYRPTNNQQDYYSGHRHFHCFHTMIVMSNNFRIVMARGGYSGHNNDAGIFRMMRQYVNLPRNLFLLADMIFPNGHPLLVPYRRNALNAVRNTPLYHRRVAINKVIRSYRPRVENIIKHIKDYAILDNVYRHPRDMQDQILDIIAGLTNRRLDMLDELV